MLRKSALAAFAFASIGFASQPALAKDVDKGKMKPDAVVGVCGEKGGTFFKSPDGANYGCGYKGGGGILCDKDTGCLETTREQEQDAIDPRWGLIGILGLAGLLGFGRKRSDDRRTTPGREA